MSTTVQLNAKVRTATGKGAARKIRQKGGVPGILYGERQEPVLVEFDGREFLRLVQGHPISNLVVDFVVAGGEAVKTLIREVQTDPLTGEVFHVDLNRISMTERIEVDVPVVVVGMPVGVKEHGGILQHAVRSLLMKCLAANIPDKVTVDVSQLMIGDSVHDFKAGHNAGCKVFLVPYGYNEGQDVQGLDADAIVATIKDAATLIQSQ